MVTARVVAHAHQDLLLRGDRHRGQQPCNERDSGESPPSCPRSRWRAG